MDYLLFNEDGSIKQSDLHQYVQEGDNNKKVLVKVDGLETGAELAQAICRLPNGQAVALAGVWNADELGWIFTFTSSVTLYYGVVLVAIRISENDINKVMFPFSLMVNQTGVNPNTDTGISLEELDAYLLTIKNWINEINIENGSGTNAAQQKRDIETVNFTGRNQNAEAIDSSLSDTFETGASGEESIALNGNTMAMAKRSMANGNKTIAKGEESHAEGYQSVTLADGSHAEGERTTAASSVSHSEGSDTIANAYASHAEGVRSQTKSFTEGGANGSHAEGESTLASGYASHTEGYGSYAGAIENAPTYPETPDVPGGGGSGGGTTQVGNAAHAEGNYCRAIGTGSHAEGYRTSALHEASHTEGVGTKSSNNGQSVMGSYNADNSDAIVIVGKGTDDENRSNALEVLADGRVVAGANGIQNVDLPRMSQVRLWKHTIYLTQPANFRLVIIDKNEESISNNLQIQGRTLDAISHKLIFSLDNTIMQLIGFPVVNMSVNIRYIDGTGTVVTSPLTINYDLVTNY